MAKGRWKRRLGWALIVVVTSAILLAATWRSWTPAAVRVALRTRGVKVAKLKWEGTDAWTFEGVERSKNGLVARAKTITTLTPWAWKRALRNGDTNSTYVTVNGWRVILPEGRGDGGSRSTNSIAQKVKAVNDGVHRALANCPRAVILNGTLQTPKGEFNFGVIDWKGGELSGNFTWPQLNDPADFKMKVIDAAKLQLIVKQTGLEIGARATAETLEDGARLAGYARWKTNRVDFDLNFADAEDTPRNAIVDSKGLSIPGRFVGMPDVEALNARMHLVITNGQFDFSMGAPPAAETGEASQVGQ
ncbi:MAG TPA: hypothetical protein VI282_04245 [Verrucomicrobiae bacterium]